MSDKMALKAAVDLMHVPSQVRLYRSEPLPDGVLTLLRIAAGDAETLGGASALIDRPQSVVHRAATFFIEQILFAPNADSYRVLGASPQASARELRRNVALLLRWLHPDLDPRGERQIFISRVTAAWNDLKTPERRAIYDQGRDKRDGKSGAKARKISLQWRGNGRRLAAGQARRHGHYGEAPLVHMTHKRRLFGRLLSILFYVPRNE